MTSGVYVHKNGRIVSKKTREKISRSVILNAKTNSNYGNKGRKWTEEIKEKFRKAAIGRQAWNKGLTKETDKRIKKYIRRGNKHYTWKGRLAYNARNYKGYGNIHAWLKNNFGKANKCENKECKHKSNFFDWALLKGKKYEFKRENFQMMCKSCHHGYDHNKEGDKNNDKTKI